MNVHRLESEMLAFEQVNCDLSHHVIGGMYARSGMIPAGHTLVGATHKTDHISVLFGDVSITTDEGVKRLTGHHVLPTLAGMKRAIYAHADTLMTTVCKTTKVEIAEIEDELVHESDKLQTRNQISWEKNSCSLPA